MRKHEESSWKGWYSSLSRFRSKTKPDSNPARILRGKNSRAMYALGAALCLALALPGRPLDLLCLQGQGSEVQLPLPLGRSFTTRYEHSVERTPVDDVYYISKGRIGQWRTRTRSHNAGLPWQAPAQGRFVVEAPWLVLEGGRRSWEDIHLRVGDAFYGRNELFLGESLRLELHTQFPGQRLRLVAGKRPLPELWFP